MYQRQIAKIRDMQQKRERGIPLVSGSELQRWGRPMLKQHISNARVSSDAWTVLERGLESYMINHFCETSDYTFTSQAKRAKQAPREIKQRPKQHQQPKPQRKPARKKSAAYQEWYKQRERPYDHREEGMSYYGLEPWSNIKGVVVLQQWRIPLTQTRD